MVRGLHIIFEVLVAAALAQVADAIAGKVGLKEPDARLASDKLPHAKRKGGDDLIEMLQRVSLEHLHRQEKETEKRSDEPDCAEEVLLRQLFAESFYGRSYDACVAELMITWFEPGGKAEMLMKPEDQGGEGKTHDEVIEKLRKKCITKQGHGAALGPRLVRMTFHDAADYNNSMLPNGTELPIEVTGVDGCLRTALLSVGLTQQADDDDLDEIAKGDPNHNRGLSNAVRWTLHMASLTGLARPDVQVLGAVTALESWFDGPELGFKYGRDVGECSKVVCNDDSCWDNDTPFFKQPVAEPVGPGFFCPMTNTLDPLRQVMGLTLDELVALQGSHSVGGVIVCSGLGNVASGPYCPTNCGVPPGDFFENGNLDGTTFDDTPGKLDNRYYQLLMDEDYEELPACEDVKEVFPHLSKRGLDKDDRTCSAGLPYEPENACDVEACVDACEKTQDCIQAENTETDNIDEFDAAWDTCLTCKRMCSSSHRKKEALEAREAHRQHCTDNCNTSAPCTLYQNLLAENFDHSACLGTCNSNKDSCLTVCNTQDGSCKTTCDSAYTQCDDQCTADMNTCKASCTDNACKRACNRARRNTCKPVCQATKETCKQACSAQKSSCQGVCWDTKNNCSSTCWDKKHELDAAEQACRGCKWNICIPEAEAIYQSIYNESALTSHPARWCKRLTVIKECLDPNFSVGTNGGWGDCPPDKRASFPNTGQGRLTIVQNLERWTEFRGLNKRIMVLPSDWSYLGKSETKALFKTYGTNEAHWKSMYVQAFTKMSELGAAPGQLKQCTAVSCTTSGANIECPLSATGGLVDGWDLDKLQEARNESGLPPFVRPASLVFDSTQCTPAAATPPTGCSVVGGYGMKAKMQCSSGYTGFCQTAAVAATEAMIASEWSNSGGQQPTCNHTLPAMLATDASPHAAARAGKRRFRGVRRASPEQDESSLLQSSVDYEAEDWEEDSPETEL